MENGIYVGLSGQLALMQRMDTLAHNVANARTPGFRAEAVNFGSVLSDVARGISYATTGVDFVDLTAGPVEPTGNPLDVAVNGDGFLATDVNGATVYTRDGRLQIGTDGTLSSVDGHPYLDVGGAPLTVDPNGGPISIASDGMVTQDGRQAGALGLFDISQAGLMTRVGTNGLQVEGEPQPILDFNRNQIRAGALEQSNVSAISEMTQLITVSRSFDALASAIDDTESATRKAVATLGGRQ